jgi:hypothetical protein
VRLNGTRSNRDGIGAVVRVSSGADQQWQMLKSGGSYLSSNELVLTFGLGANPKAERVEVDWPSGQVDKLSNVDTGQTILVAEGKGIVRSFKYGQRPTAAKANALAGKNAAHAVRGK